MMVAIMRLGIKIITIISLLLCLGFSRTVFATPLSYADNITFNSATSQLIYTNPKGSQLTAIDTRMAKVLRKIELPLPKQALMIGATPDGFKLLYLDKKGLSVIHNGTGKVLRTLAHPRGYQAIYNRRLMAQNTNGSLIAIPYKRGNNITLFMMHTGSGKIINQVELPASRYALPNPIEAIAFSKNNRLLAYTRHSADDKGRMGSTLYIYDLYAKKELQSIFLPIHRYNHQKNTSNRLQFSQDGQNILLLFPNKITLVDRKTETIKDIIVANADAVFNANSQYVIYKSKTSNPMMINVRNGKVHKIATYPANHQQSRALVQSGNKRFIAIPLLSQQASFLIINGQTGAFVRLLEEQVE